MKQENTNPNYFTKFIKITPFYLILLLTIVTVIAPVAGALRVQAQTINTPEGILSLEFTTPLSDTILGSRLRGYDIDILSLGSKIDIDGKKQNFSLPNNDRIGTIDFLNTYQKSYTAFLSTLSALKNRSENNQKLQSIEPILRKYTKTSLNRKIRQNKVDILKINTLSISGKLTVLNKLKINHFFGLASKIELIDLVKIYQDSKNLKIEMESANTDQEKQDVLNDGIAKIAFQQLIPNNGSKLDLDQNKIQEVDKLLKKDIIGNLFIQFNELKKLLLDDVQSAKVIQAISDYNKIPIEVKDGSDQAVNAILESIDFKSELQKQDGVTDKIIASLTKSIEVKAGNWGSFSWNVWNQWWGVKVWINRAIMNTILNGGAGLVWSILWTSMIGTCSYISAGWLITTCVWLIRTVLSAIIWNIRDWISRQPWWCNKGANIELNWNGSWGIYCS